MARKTPPRLLRIGMNLWPPFLGAGIRVRSIAPDFREVRVDMRLGVGNRNYFGTHFGGSLYAMTDPFFVLMVHHNLPSGYMVWDKAGSIEYVAPGRGPVSATLRLEQTDVDTIVRMTADGDKHLHLFQVDIVDREGLTVAKVQKIVYARKKSEQK